MVVPCARRRTRSSATTVTALPDRHSEGLLDTSVVIDVAVAEDAIGLPEKPSICSVTLAELSYGVALAADPLEAARRSARYARLRTWFAALPFDERAADRYGELVALTRAYGREPRPRRLDLMIAAVAVSNGLPLFTMNPDDFRGLESVLEVVGPPCNRNRGK